MTTPSPGGLARLDQGIANYRHAVTQLVATHRGPVAEVGREVATAQLAALLATQDPAKVAGIAAVALDLLAHGDRP